MEVEYQIYYANCVLFKMCGIMNKLRENGAVMADRGFKQIETVLLKKIVNLFDHLVFYRI